MRRPLRAVFELSGPLLPGDEGNALDTDWLVQVGTGLELDFSDSRVPLIDRGRVMVRYARGEFLQGFSVGIAASF